MPPWKPDKNTDNTPPQKPPKKSFKCSIDLLIYNFKKDLSNEKLPSTRIKWFKNTYHCAHIDI